MSMSFRRFSKASQEAARRWIERIYGVRIGQFDYPDEVDTALACAVCAFHLYECAWNKDARRRIPAWLYPFDELERLKASVVGVQNGTQSVVYKPFQGEEPWTVLLATAFKLCPKYVPPVAEPVARVPHADPVTNELSKILYGTKPA